MCSKTIAMTTIFPRPSSKFQDNYYFHITKFVICSLYNIKALNGEKFPLATHQPHISNFQQIRIKLFISRENVLWKMFISFSHSAIFGPRASKSNSNAIIFASVLNLTLHAIYSTPTQIKNGLLCKLLLPTSSDSFNFSKTMILFTGKRFEFLWNFNFQRSTFAKRHVFFANNWPPTTKCGIKLRMQ